MRISLLVATTSESSATQGSKHIVVGHANVTAKTGAMAKHLPTAPGARERSLSVMYGVDVGLQVATTFEARATSRAAELSVGLGDGAALDGL